MEDTIAAMVTAPGPAGVAIVRVSGPEAFRIADGMFSGPGRPPSRRRSGTFVHGQVHGATECPLDEVLCLVMRAPRSYTGEDVVEFQGHGGAMASRAILRRAIELGARSAEPGEFTRRAFLNGRMDLTQAEAVADLIHARSDRAATMALHQLEGQLRDRIQAVYRDVVAVGADLEATLDFPEDELPEPVFAEILVRVDEIRTRIDTLCSTWNEGHRLRDGALVVISGRPNVGKSTLMNALLGRDRAIVSAHAGTTRDVLEESMVVEGVPVRLIDTAGLRESDCEVEREGVGRAIRLRDQADLRILVLDATREMTPEEDADATSLRPGVDLVVMNKNDAIPPKAVVSIPRGGIRISARTGVGIPDLLRRLGERLTQGFESGDSHDVAVSERHRERLTRAASLLDQARARLAEDPVTHCVPAADDLRDAAESLAEITGQSYREDLLDAVFSRFCIGK